MIEVEGLRKAFGGRPVLDGVDLHVPRGRMLALLGPNGAGKTTAVRIMATLLRPDGGDVRIGGHDVIRDAARVRRVIGLTGQQVALDAVLTGHENLVMMGRLFGLGTKAARRRAGELLERFDLTEAASRPVKTYSGGMKRRLDLSISLVTSPPVLFLDEPTTGLDPRGRSEVWDVVRGLLADGTSILLTTQYLDEADQLADRVAVISDGRIVAEGTADELKQAVGSERLELAFAGPEVVRRAQRVVDGVAAGRGISVPVEGAKDIKQVLDRLDEAAIDVAGIALAKPTLDDVFLTLTGGLR
ncbi:MAG TPA: ATP-binding cassette domain-containing protein [Amycolatopsis sp.]|nr:ATP-binding cassette domain-containing protein [Amycolatopsis sp.]